ncbi:MAG TPA: hypothetical protein VJ103_00705 [Candidatus Paceibacterota bacterium]|nr:hypothetical protein [Candidatus Paceibacterota bacterium]
MCVSKTRAYDQREPLVEYKKEGLRLFREMEQAFNDQVLNLIDAIDVKAAEKDKEGTGGKKETG